MAPSLPPNPPPRKRAVDADLPGLNAQGVADLEAVAERGLGGDGQVQDAVLVQAGQAVFGFQKGVGLGRGEVGFLQDHIALRQGLLGVSFVDLGAQEDVGAVGLMDERGIRRQGRVHVGQGLQGLDVHVDEGQGLPQHFA